MDYFYSRDFGFVNSYTNAEYLVSVSFLKRAESIHLQSLGILSQQKTEKRQCCRKAALPSSSPFFTEN